MKTGYKFAIFITIAVIVCTIPLYAEEETGADDNPVKKLNNIIIDTEKKEIRLQCKLALDQGILEFLLVDEMGQTYESVFKIVESKPSDLQFGLLLLGFEPVDFSEYTALLNDKDAVAKLKSKKALLQLEFQKEDKPVPVSALLGVREAGAEYPAYWVFTGGYFTEKNKFAADLSLIFISIWPEQSSVINLLSAAGNPYRGMLGFEIAAGGKFLVDDEFTLVLKGVE